VHISNEQGKTIKVVVIWISSEAIVPTEAQVWRSGFHKLFSSFATHMT
jgi:hypothetical protein